MLNLPIKILRTVQIEAETEAITIDNIAALVAQWDAAARVTSRHLVLIINARSIDVSDSITNFLRFNADAGMNYMYQRLSGVDGVDSAGRVDGANAINLPPITGANNANTWGGSMVLIPHAFNATNHKAVLAVGGSSEFTVEAVAARWASVAAITSVTVFEGVGDDFVVGSTVSLGVVDERYLVEEWISAGVGTAIFDNIPQGEGDLVVIGYARSSQAANEDEVLHYINDDDVAGNYPAQEMLGRGGATSAATPVNGECAMIPGQTAGINIFGALVINYSQYIKDNQPHFLSASGYQSGIPLGEVRVMSGRRANIEPINKIELDPTLGVNFFTGSLISLYRVPKRIIDRVELTAPQAVVTFDNIPQNFEALLIHIYARSDVAAAAAHVGFQFNDDAAGGNYPWGRLLGSGAVVTALRAASRNLLFIPGDTAGANEFGGGTALLPGYYKDDRHKCVITLSGRAEDLIGLLSARWASVAAVIKIELVSEGANNFMAGSVFELEGILRKEGLPPSEGEQFGV